MLITWVHHQVKPPWFVYILAISCFMIGLHWSFLWCPSQWRWIVAQILTYCVAVGSDFIIWYIDPDSGEWWIWIAGIYGGIIILQGIMYTIVTYIGPLLHRKFKRRKRKRKSIEKPLLPSLPHSPITSYNSISKASTNMLPRSTRSSRNSSGASSRTFLTSSGSSQAIDAGSDSGIETPEDEIINISTNINSGGVDSTSEEAYVAVANPSYAPFFSSEVQSPQLSMSVGSPYRIYDINVGDTTVDVHQVLKSVVQ
eukprot:TRINITY_DN1428_c0_g1_i1.p1 TRINITY_DN1428_c0_g1~~TRINITY_DN1428_c0_g1_i1.p1  ORF type:complete len:255 (+),score=22.58 TRINITY_DN1428_c0_g1_i1:473-1237(+)